MNTNDLKLNEDDVNAVEYMPMCFEKLLITLMLEISRVNRAKEKNSEYWLEQTKELKRRVELEDLNTSWEVNGLLDKISQAFEKLDLKNGFFCLKQILALTRDLHVNKLIRLLSENNDALDIVEEKDVFLFIGYTGAGKSTTLHFLCGTSLIKQQNSDRIIIAPDHGPFTDANLDRITLGTSHVESQTQNVLPIVLTNNEQEVIICDTPGFCDTRGFEIDISNAVALRKCVQKCAALKPVLVVSNQLGDRLQFLTQLARILNTLFLNFTQDVRLFSFVYTKFKSPTQIVTLLEQTLKNIDQKIGNNEPVVDGLRELVAEMLNQSSTSVLVDPINGDRNAILARLFNPEKVRFLTKPDDHIWSSIGDASKLKLDAQIDRLERAIERAVQVLDFDLVKYRFGQLNQITTLIGQRDIRLKFNSIVTKLIQNFNKQVRDKLDRLQSASAVVSDVDLSALIDLRASSLHLNSLFGDVDLTDDVKLTSSEDIIKRTCTVYDNVLNGLCAGQFGQPQAESMVRVLDSLKNYIYKHDGLNLDATQYRLVYDTYVARVVNLGANMASRVEDLIRQGQPEVSESSVINNLSCELDSLKGMSAAFKNHPGVGDFNYGGSIELLHEAIRSESIAYDLLLNETDLDKLARDVNETLSNGLLKTTRKLKLILSSESLVKNHLNKELVQQYQRNLNSKMVACFGQLVLVCHELISQLEEISFVRDSISPLANLPGVNKAAIHQKLMPIRNHHDRVDYSLLEKLFFVLNSFKQMLVECVDSFNQLLKKLTDCIVNIKGKVMQNFTVHNVDKMGQIFSKLKWIERFKPNYIKYIVEDFQEINDSCLYQLDAYLGSLNLNVNQMSLDEMSQIEQSISSVNNHTGIRNVLISLDKPDIKPTQTKSSSLKNLTDQVGNLLQTLNLDIQAATSNEKRLFLDDEDVKFANNVINFIRHFPLSLLEVSSQSTEENLRQFLKVRTRTTEIDNDLRSILASTYSTRDENVKKAKSLCKFLCELKKFTKSDRLLVYFPDELNTVDKCAKFVANLNEPLVEKMNKNITETNLIESSSTLVFDSTDLNANVEVLNGLRACVDDELVRDSHGKCSDRIQRLKLQTFNEIKNDILAGQFEKTKGKMLQFNRQNTIDRARQDELGRTLNATIKKMCTEINKDVEDEIDSCADGELFNLRSIESKYQSIREVFDSKLVEWVEPQVKEIYNECQTRVKTSVNARLETELNEIRLSISNFNSKVENRLQAYSKSNQLRKHLENLEIPSSHLNSIVEIRSNLKNQIQTAIDNYVNNFNIHNISQNSPRPKVVDQKLTKFKFGEIDECRAYFYEQLEYKINTAWTNTSLAHFTQMQNEFDVYFPGELQKYLREKIANQNNTNNVNFINEQLKLVTFDNIFNLDQDEIANMFSHLQKAYSKCKSDQEFTSLIDQNVLTKVHDIVNKFNQSTKDGHNDKQMKHALALCIACSQLGYIVGTAHIQQFLNKSLNDCGQILKNQFNKTRDQLRMQLENIQAARYQSSQEATLNEITNVKEKFELLNLHFILEHDLKFHRVFLDDIRFKSDYEELIALLEKILIDLKLSFKQRLNDPNPFEVGKTMREFDCIQFLSALNFLFKDMRYVQESQQAKENLVNRVSLIKHLIIGQIDELLIVSGERKQPQQLNDVFTKLNSYFKFIHELTGEQEMADMIEFESHIHQQLLDNMSALFVILEDYSDSVTSSSSDDSSNQYHNVYHTIESFRNQMPDVYRRYFGDDVRLWNNIRARVNHLLDQIVVDGRLCRELVDTESSLNEKLLKFQINFATVDSLIIDTQKTLENLENEKAQHELRKGELCEEITQMCQDDGATIDEEKLKQLQDELSLKEIYEDHFKTSLEDCRTEFDERENLKTNVEYELSACMSELEQCQLSIRHKFDSIEKSLRHISNTLDLFSMHKPDIKSKFDSLISQFYGEFGKEKHNFERMFDLSAQLKNLLN